MSTIESHIQKVKDTGIEPDLIIIDYADLVNFKKQVRKKRDKLDDIYTNLQKV